MRLFIYLYLFTFVTLFCTCQYHNYLKIIKKGSYVGYVCLFNELITNNSFSEDPYLIDCHYIRNCTAKGRKSEYFTFSYDSYPIIDIKPGSFMRCKVMCDTRISDFDHEKGGWTYRIVYDDKNMTYMSNTPIIDNGSYVDVHLTYVHLISAKHLKIKFDNKYLKYSNLTIKTDVLRFKVSIIGDKSLNSYQASNMIMEYGRRYCPMKKKIGVITVRKPDVPKKISEIKNELENLKNQTKLQTKHLKILSEKYDFKVMAFLFLAATVILSIALISLMVPKITERLSRKTELTLEPNRDFTSKNLQDEGKPAEQKEN